MRKKLTKKRLAELQAKFPLTPQEKNIILSAGYGVWNDIAYDAITMGGEGSESDTLSADSVIELVIDASRLESRLTKADKTWAGVARLFPKKYDSDASDYLWELMREQFPSGRYGL